MYKRGLFNDWVPKPVQLLLIIIGISPFLIVSGIYSSNINDMVSGTGALSEVFTLANYAFFFGIATALPLLMRTKQYFRSKDLTIGCLLLLSLMSWMYYTSDNAILLITASFFIGVCKMTGLIEFVVPVFYLITPTFDRNKFYPIFYPLTIAVSSFSGYYFSVLSYTYNWEHVYLYMIIFMLFCALLATVFMHNYRGSKKVPLYQFPWISILLFVSLLMVSGYVLVFTKYHGWFQSPEIFWGICIFLILLLLFYVLEKSLKRPFLEFSAFKRKTVYLTLIMVSLLGIYLGSSSMQSTYMVGVLKYSFQTMSYINLAMIPGLILAGITSYIWFKKALSLKGLILLGFGANLAAQIIFYFMFAPVVDIEDFILPTILKGFSLTIIYIATASYCAQNLSNKETISVFAILTLFRSFVGPAVFGSILTWIMYKLQLQNASDLVAHIDGSDSFTLLRGGGMGLYGTTQIQSILLAVKQVFGVTIIAGAISLIYIAFQRFGPVEHRRLVLISKRVKGENTKDYKRKITKEKEERAIEEATQIVV